jgi:hypothetical protein
VAAIMKLPASFAMVAWAAVPIGRPLPQRSEPAGLGQRFLRPAGHDPEQPVPGGFGSAETGAATDPRPRSACACASRAVQAIDTVLIPICTARLQRIEVPAGA